MKPIVKIEQIRLANLQSLISEFGTVTEVGRLSGTSRIYLSQILTRSASATGKSREVGTKLARKLEKGCGKPEGWMDINHNGIDHDSVVPSRNELGQISELVHIYSSLDEEMRMILLQLAKLISRIRRRKDK